MSEKAMAPHSSTLAGKIPWTEEPGRLQSMRSRRVGRDWATSLSLFPFMHWRRKWQPTPLFLPGESQGRGSLVGCRLWGRTRLKRLSSSSKLGCQYFLAFNTLKQGQPFSVQCLYKFWEELVWLMQKVKMEDSLTWFLLQTWVVLPVFKCPKGRIKDF